VGSGLWQPAARCRSCRRELRQRAAAQACGRGAQVAQWLLANDYLLAALELLVEAQEAGREDELESLQLFFADRNRFPPEELARFDQHDGASARPPAARGACMRFVCRSVGRAHVCGPWGATWAC